MNIWQAYPSSATCAGSKHFLSTRVLLVLFWGFVICLFVCFLLLLCFLGSFVFVFVFVCLFVCLFVWGVGFFGRVDGDVVVVMVVFVVVMLCLFYFFVLCVAWLFLFC